MNAGATMHRCRPALSHGIAYVAEFHGFPLLQWQKDESQLPGYWYMPTKNWRSRQSGGVDEFVKSNGDRQCWLLFSATLSWMPWSTGIKRRHYDFFPSCRFAVYCREPCYGR